jgi:hypothetical protein
MGIAPMLFAVFQVFLHFSKHLFILPGSWMLRPELTAFARKQLLAPVPPLAQAALFRPEQRLELGLPALQQCFQVPQALFDGCLEQEVRGVEVGLFPGVGKLLKPGLCQSLL